MDNSKPGLRLSIFQLLFSNFFWFLILFIFTISLSQAQNSTVFSGNPDEFLSETEAYFNRLSNSDDKKKAELLIRDFRAVYDSKLTATNRISMSSIAQTMIGSKLKSHRNYFTLLQFLVFLQAGEKSSENISSWLAYADFLIEAKRLNDFEALLTASNDWMQERVVGKRGTITWYLRNANWNFTYSEGKLLMPAQGNLVAATKKDSLVIHQTEGILFFSTNEWQGKGGELFWWRFGQKGQDVKVTFSSYFADLTSSGIMADTVVLRHPAYFQTPVLGRFEDQVFNSPPGIKTSYPRFSSYLSDYELNNLFPDVRYRGGINLEGADFIGKSDQGRRAEVTFMKNKKAIVRLLSNSFLITSDRIQTERGSMKIYLDNDSIFHPGLWFKYDHLKRQLTMLRPNISIPDGGPFINTFHKLNMFAEAAYWQLDSDEIIFKQADGLQNSSVVSAESLDFFSMDEYRKLQGMDAENPLAALLRFKESMGIDKEVQLLFLSEYLKKPPEQVAAILLRLASLGYLIYDSEQEKAYLDERFDAVMAARAEKKDFDVIRFNSVTSSKIPNMVLDITGNDLKMSGIKEVVLSENQGVQLFPDSNQIVLKKNRDFVFSGLVKAGLFDFFARTAHFDYAAFKLNLSDVDSLSFAVPLREQSPDAKDKKFIRVRNVLADLIGTLYIDEPFNKSGMKNLPRFPIFSSKNESYVYFDKNFIQDGQLKRDKFFYVVEAFEIDSLDNFSTDNLRFDGYLTSAGIFPVFREPLTVMKDYSLGFEHSVPKEGYQMFGGLAHFYNTVSLSNMGFGGLGRLDYITSTVYSKSFNFSPLQVTARTDAFEMRERRTQVEFPQGKGTVLELDWQVENNNLFVQTDTLPLQLFGEAGFKGKMKIAPGGAAADGKIAFDQAVIISHFFDFKSRSLKADTADFKLLADNSEKEAFLANDYLTNIDFEKRSATFKYINQNSRLSFPFNQFVCTLDEADWSMDKQTIALNNNRIDRLYDFSELSFKDLIGLNLKGSEFRSVLPEQDSLTFFCLRANYDLKDYLILAKDVKIIRVGDAAIFPSDSIVAIGKDAELKPIESASIIADTSTMYHLFTDARVNIFSRKAFTASATYAYVNMRGERKELLFNNIASDPSGITMATSEITADQKFDLNPWFGFVGKAKLDARRKWLWFEGGYQLKHNCSDDAFPYIAFDTVVDPMNVQLPVRTENKDINGLPIRNGFYYASVTDSYYGAFLQNPRASSDKVLADAAGLLWYDPATMSYRVEAVPGKNNSTFLALDTDHCIVKGKSDMNLDLRLTNISLETTGSYTYKMIPDSLYLNLFASINFAFDDKLLSVMADSLNSAGLQAGASLEDYYLAAAKTKMNTSDFDRLSSEVALYGAPRKVPDPMNKTLVFSKLDLKWNPQTRSFVSTGALHLANVGKVQVNKMVNGFIEIEKTRSGDAFSIYLMLSTKQWYFFSYKSGVMQSLSSSDVFNTELMKIKPEKRVINDPKTGGRYEFTISTRRKMVDFLRKMQNLEF